MSMEKISVNCDFSEVGVEIAFEQLGGLDIPHIVVSPANKLIAQKICGEHRWSWGIDETLTADAWKVTLRGNTIYSPGA